MSTNFIRGDKVIARNDFYGYYYPGKINKVVDTKHADIEFESGYVQKKLNFKYIRKLFDSRSYFSLGDYVLASVINEYDQLCWVPGIIQSIDDYATPKEYTVLYFNGQESENIKLEMVKINKSSYGSIVENIRYRLGLNTKSKHSTDLKTVHACNKVPSPEPPRAETPPDLGEIKKDIIDQIKMHLESLKLDAKYEAINAEFSNIKETHKNLQSSLGSKLRNLTTDFEEWKNQEPKIIIHPNKILNPKNEKVKQKPHPSLNLEQKIVRLRSELPHLIENEPCVARWPQNGWYYKSTVKRYLGDFKYRIIGESGETVDIYREDLIQENINDVHSFEIGDPVIAPHPHYPKSLAPGQVIKKHNNKGQVSVRLYDYIEHTVDNEDVYKLNILKFQSDIDMINYLECKWIGQTVLARNNETNLYEAGKIVGRVGNAGRQYIIEWADGEESLQNFNHILGGAAKNPSLVANECVFTLRGSVFCPGRITGRKGDKLIVKFFDGETIENVEKNDCYWISKSYYKEVANFYKNNKEPINFSFKRCGCQSRATPVIDARQFYSGKKIK